MLSILHLFLDSLSELLSAFSLSPKAQLYVLSYLRLLGLDASWIWPMEDTDRKSEGGR